MTIFSDLCASSKQIETDLGIKEGYSAIYTFVKKLMLIKFLSDLLIVTVPWEQVCRLSSELTLFNAFITY